MKTEDKISALLIARGYEREDGHPISYCKQGCEEHPEISFEVVESSYPFGVCYRLVARYEGTTHAPMGKFCLDWLKPENIYEKIENYERILCSALVAALLENA